MSLTTLCQVRVTTMEKRSASTPPTARHSCRTSEVQLGTRRSQLGSDTFIEEQHSSQAASAIVIPVAVSQIEKARKEVFPAGLLCDAELVGSERTKGKQIFETQLTLAKPQAFTVGVTDYGIAEVRTCIEGQELYIGFPADCVPGNDLIDKVNMLHRLTMQQVQECQSGFRCVLVPGKTLCIPAGYMLCSVAVSDKPSTSIRWGSLNVANHRCCLSALQIVKGMLQTTDGLSDDNVWVSWKDASERLRRAAARQ